MALFFRNARKAILATVPVLIVLYAGARAGDPSASVRATVVSQEAGAFPFLVTQVPASAGGSADTSVGGRILEVAPGGKTILLTGGFQSARDPDVSFDGKRILFAGKKSASDPWDIYEMKADGTSVRRITRGLGDCRSPVYLSTLYTIVSDKPWYTIAFVSDEAGERSADGCSANTSLYSCRLDGTSARRLTFNPFGDRTPFLLQDGRLIFSGRRPSGDAGPRAALFGINIDGTDYAAFSGDQGRGLLHSPCATSRGKVVFVEADPSSGDGSGDLAEVSLRRNLHSYRKIAGAGKGRFLSPSPLPDGEVLVSRIAADRSGTYAIGRLDPATGAFTTLFDDPQYQDLQAKRLGPRPEPEGRSSVVDESDPTGRLYCLNVYVNDLPDRKWLPSGTARSIRVLEGVPRKREPGAGTPSDGSLSPRLGKRLLGQAPVESDGSFNIQIPADIPVQIQLLDSDGLALRTCTWIWVKNKEPRGCIGCHEDGELAPANELKEAIVRPSTPLTLPPEKRRTLDFEHDIAPIIKNRCSFESCHGGRARPDFLGAVTPGGAITPEGLFHALLARSPSNGSTSGFRYLDPGRARISPLIHHLLGRNTSRPWDREDGRGVGLAPSHPILSGNELRLMIEWIDLGASWKSMPESGISAPATGRNRGVR